MPRPDPFPYCRLTVLAPRSRVDVALPADVPLGELTPMVLELLGEPRGTGRRPEPWSLTGPTGGILAPEATLNELGVLDGELLRIGPTAPPPPAPVFDDPVEALASSAGAAAADGGRRLGAAAVVGVAVVAGVLLAGVHPETGGVVVLAIVLSVLGAVAALTRAAQLTRVSDAAGRPPPDRLGALTAAVAAVPLAAAAGWLLLRGPPGAGSFLLAIAAAGITAAVGQAVLRVVAPILVGTVVAATLLAGGALVQLQLAAPVPAVAAGVGALALVTGPMLPRAALRLAGLPGPLVPGDAPDLVGADGGPDLLPPEELAERADLARGHLAGLVGGYAVVAAAAGVTAAMAGGWTGPAFAAVTSAALILRARGFADPAPARTQWIAGILAGAGLAAVVATAGGPGTRLWMTVALLFAVAAGSVAVSWSGPPMSPVVRRAVDIAEGVLVAAAVPLALGAMDLYALVRGL